LEIGDTAGWKPALRPRRSPHHALSDFVNGPGGEWIDRNAGAASGAGFELVISQRVCSDQHALKQFTKKICNPESL